MSVKIGKHTDFLVYRRSYQVFTMVPRENRDHLDSLGENVNPCATPCTRSTNLDTSPSGIKALLEHPATFFIILNIFPLIPLSYSFLHSPILPKLCRRPFVHLEINRPLIAPVSFRPWIVSPIVYTQLTVRPKPCLPSA